MTEIIGEVLKGIGIIIGIAIYEFWKRRRRAKLKAVIAENSSIEMVEQVNRDVKEVENQIKHEFQAMRMFVIHWNNGTKTEAGIHLLKITVKHEVIMNHRIRKIEKYFQEITTPQMWQAPFTKVIEDGIFHLRSIDDLDVQDPVQKEYRDWLTAYEVRGVLWVALQNKHGKLIAILVMHFPANSRIYDTDIANIKDLKKDIEKIYNNLKHEA